MRAQPLYKAASYDSDEIALIDEGQSIIVLQKHIVNENEMGGRGGPAVFDYVEIPDNNIKGYIQRAGDDFPPYY